MAKSEAGQSDMARIGEADAAHINHGELLYMMHELSRLISVYFDNAMRPHGLTHSQWWALMHISLHEGSSQSELARIMQMGRAAASKTFERLEAKNWIERRADATDSRVLRIHLCDKGTDVLRAMREAGAEQFEKLLKDIPAQEEAALLAGLRKIKANAEMAIKEQHGSGQKI